ncbi:predicted protein [Naegleria gruberi]|uniref:Predicted protein n=1 Tax=Naegleria gruberi TaxID=5762 RepID=D2V444_NAEGR|nr:uncharacterized protein NAEGRDRAFT_63592 [Naegleria gruberi]EFC48316.1 predicted protein [Naegleria gruberi]|eukprot:XP_002681060.1 predicted protein [Naegleria gruberi strain NEG-M]
MLEYDYSSAVENGVLRYLEIKYRDHKVALLNSKGSYGKIYKITNTNDQTKIKALKVMRDVDNFDIHHSLEEGTRMLKYSHLNCNIAKVFDVFILYPQEAERIMGLDESGQPPFQHKHLCIEMEYYENGSLDSVFKSNQDPSRDSKPKLTSSILKQILKQITLALKHVQEYDHIIHNDIKPDNILVGNIEQQVDNDQIIDIQVYLSDFGLAITPSESPASNYNLKKPFYPYEEIPSKSADIFALSVSLYDLTTKQLTAQQDRSLRNVQCDDETIRMNYHNAGISDDQLINVLISMMNKDASKRPTCDQILDGIGVTYEKTLFVKRFEAKTNSKKTSWLIYCLIALLFCLAAYFCYPYLEAGLLKQKSKNMDLGKELILNSIESPKEDV